MIYQLPEPTKSSPKKWRAFIIPDTHVGYHAGLPAHDPLAENVMLQSLEHYAPNLTHVIVLGDFGNWESLSHWAALRAEHIFIEEEVRLVNAHLDLIDEAAGKKVKKIFIEGNHEAWSTLLEAKYPQFRDVVNLKQRLFRDRDNWTWIPNNHYFKLGKLYYTHGNLPGARDMESLLKVAGKSVMCGHNHQHMIARHRNLDGQHIAISSGCLASIDPPPPYAKASIPGTWVHGFHTVQYRANGLFQMSWHEIIDQSYTELTDGKEIIANHFEVMKRLREDEAITTQCRREYEERYYHPGGNVTEQEPVGRTEYSSRGRRARVIANREK